MTRSFSLGRPPTKCRRRALRVVGATSATLACVALAAVAALGDVRAAEPTAGAPRAAAERAVGPTVVTTATTLSPTAVALSGAAPQGDAERGVVLYDAHCAGCHGPTGRGDGPLVDRLPAPPPSLADRTRMRESAAADLWRTVTTGRLERGMPPFSRLLSDAERWDVVAAVRAFGDQHPLLLAAADAGWTHDCASCHGSADAFAGELAADSLVPDPAAPPGVDALAVRSPAAMRAAFDGAGAHAATPFDDRSIEAALAGLRRRGSRPLTLPGAASGGRIEGRVVLPGGAAPEAARGTTVTLHADALGLGVDLGAVPLASDGAFAVDGLVVGDGIAYEPEAWFDGVRYRPTSAVTLTSSVPSRADVVVEVFPADPNAPVQIAALSGLAKADPERGEVAVFEVWQIANDGQRTRVSAGGAPTFRLPLPVGARDVVLEDRTGREDVASRSDASDEGYIASRLPVPPGGREIVASYGMPYRGTTAVLDRTMPDGAAQLGWVLADEGALAESDQLSGPSPDRFGDQPVQRYVGGPLAADQHWTIRITGLPPAAEAPASPQDVLGPAPKAVVQQAHVRTAAVVLAAIGVLAALLAGATVRRARRGRSPSRRAARAYNGVIAALVRLDSAFERGEIAPNAHRRRRAALVARALALRAATAGDQAAPFDADPGSAAGEEA